MRHLRQVAIVGQVPTLQLIVAYVILQRFQILFKQLVRLQREV